MARKTLETLTAIISSQACGVAVLDVAGDVEAGVGEEDVDAAEALERGGDHAVDLGGAGEVGGQDEGLGARRRRRATASSRSAERAASARRAPSRAEHPRRARGRCRSWRR